MPKNSFDTVIEVPVANCRLGLSFDDDLLVNTGFISSDIPLTPPRSAERLEIIDQITAYFSNPHQSFKIKPKPSGTAFQKRVWQALSEIPVGTTLTYGALAQVLSSSPRAVGNACRVNPIPLIVPCHRVVSASGIGGFMGKRDGNEVSIKECLLRHERAKYGC